MLRKFRDWMSIRISLVSTIHALKTLLILLSYGAVGYSDSLFGVNMSQFEFYLNATTEETSKLIPIAFSGFTLGNMMLSFSCNYINLHMVYVGCVGLLTFCNLVIPHLTSWWALFATFFLNGVAGGTIEAASVARILVLWGRESATLLQLLDFVYGIGAILGPFVSEPFLQDLTNELRKATLTRNDIKMIYPYSVIGGFAGIVFVTSIIVVFSQKKDIPHPSRLSDRDDKSDLSADCGSRKSMKVKRGIMIFLAALTYACSNGMGMIEQGFLAKYVTISGYKMNTSDGASMEGASWIVHTVSGLLFIFVIRRVGLAKNLIITSTLIFASNLVLTIFSGLHIYEPYVLWTCVVGMAIGGCTFFGSLVSFLETRFPVSARASSYYLIPNCIGNIVWPLIVGQYIEAFPDIFVYFMAGCGFFACLTVGIMLLMSKCILTENDGSNNNSRTRDQGSYYSKSHG